VSDPNASFTGSATAEEAAAVLTAIRLYLQEQSETLEAGPTDRWLRAARLEAVGRSAEITFGRGWEG